MKYSLRIDKILEVFANWLLSGWQWNATDAVTNLEFMIFLFSLLFHLEESIRFMIFNRFTNFLNQYISTKEGIRSVILASWGSQVIWKCWYLGINKKTTIKKEEKQNKRLNFTSVWPGCLDSQETEYLCFVKATGISQICTMLPWHWCQDSSKQTWWKHRYLPSLNWSSQFLEVNNDCLFFFLSVHLNDSLFDSAMTVLTRWHKVDSTWD